MTSIPFVTPHLHVISSLCSKNELSFVVITTAAAPLLKNKDLVLVVLELNSQIFMIIYSSLAESHLVE